MVSPDIYVIEQGEPADALYLILNGTADALLEHPDGQVTHVENAAVSRRAKASRPE